MSQLDDRSGADNAGAIRPIPQVIFPLSAAPAALRQLAAAKHIGKVVVEVGGAEDQRKSERKATEAGRWVITGGLGGLGSLSSHWLATRGMQTLILLGRSG